MYSIEKKVVEEFMTTEVIISFDLSDYDFSSIADVSKFFKDTNMTLGSDVDYYINGYAYRGKDLIFSSHFN